MTSPPKITALILAGGEGRRVDRQNKGLIPFRGIPLIRHVINRIHPTVQTILISANHNITEYETFGFPVYEDLPEWAGQGPLAGIISLFPHVPPDSDYILTVPCDTPFLPANLVSSLTNAFCPDPNLQIAYAATPEKIHPSIFISKPYINKQLASHLQQKNRSLRSWIFRHANLKVEFPDEHAFTNMNDFQTITNNQ